MAEQFQDRINYQGDLKIFLGKVCEDFSLGSYSGHNVIPQGYEDLNLRLQTQRSSAFVKVFAKSRGDGEAQRIVDVLRAVADAQVRTPQLYKASSGYLDQVVVSGTSDPAIVSQYLEGQNLYESKVELSEAEKRDLIYQAALINQLRIQPSPIYDQWAIPNFIKEYERKVGSLSNTDRQLVDPLVTPFRNLNIDGLPHSLVHGDIIKTNVMKSSDGKLYIVDFSVANYYPRIQELAVMLNSTLFDENDIGAYKADYQLALDEYQKYIKLTAEELTALPLFVRVGHAMHLLNATWERENNGNDSEENAYWLNLGRIGLQFTQQMWN